MIWPRLMGVGGIALTICLYLFYARPHRQAVQADGGGTTGEPILAIGYGPLSIAGGALAHWGFARFYGSKQMGRGGTGSDRGGCARRRTP